MFLDVVSKYAMLERWTDICKKLLQFICVITTLKNSNKLDNVYSSKYVKQNGTR